MSRITPSFVAAFVVSSALFVACGGDDGDGTPRRVIQIVQTNEACTPQAINVTAGEKVRFEVRNDADKDKEVEGIEGTRLEEVLVPSGKTRSLNWEAPDKAGVQKIKCYQPGGASTVIEVTVAAAP